jgi:hypothetical protein
MKDARMVLLRCSDDLNEQRLTLALEAPWDDIARWRRRPVVLAWWASEFGHYVDLDDEGSHIGNGEGGEGTRANDSGN